MILAIAGAICGLFAAAGIYIELKARTGPQSTMAGLLLLIAFVGAVFCILAMLIGSAHADG